MNIKKVFNIDKLCFVTITTLIFIVQPLSAQEVHILGNESMPFNGIVNGQNAGMTYEILQEATKHGAPKFKFDLGLPWKRAQKLLHLAEDSPTAIVPFTRTKKREHNYTWIAKLISYQTRVSTTDKTSDISIYYLKRKPIGIIRGSAHIPLLEKLGFTRISLANTATENVLKLSEGYIYSIAESQFVDSYNWKKIGKRVEDLQFIPVGQTKHIYIAGNLSFPLELKDRISSAIEKMSRNGRLQAIINRWEK